MSKEGKDFILSVKLALILSFLVGFASLSGAQGNEIIAEVTSCTATGVREHQWQAYPKYILESGRNWLTDYYPGEWGVLNITFQEPVRIDRIRLIGSHPEYSPTTYTIALINEKGRKFLIANETYRNTYQGKGGGRWASYDFSSIMVKKVEIRITGTIGFSKYSIRYELAEIQFYNQGEKIQIKGKCPPSPPPSSSNLKVEKIGRFRERASLSGYWEYTVDSRDGLFPSPKGWRVRKVPLVAYFPKGEELTAHNTFWIRRNFIVPESMKAKKIELFFEGIDYFVKLWLNGQEIFRAQNNYGDAGFSVDITDKAKIGQINKIMVQVTGIKSLFKKSVPNIVSLKGPFDNRVKDNILGISTGLTTEMYGVENIYLESKPLIYIEDVFVKTSVRDKKIDAEIILKNESDFPCKIRIKNSITNWKEEAIVKEFIEKPGIVLEPRSTKLVTITQSWINPQLWWPYLPHLYTLKTCLEKEGQLIDQKDIRFGYREFWCDGMFYRLNGVKVRLFGLVGDAHILTLGHKNFRNIIRKYKKNNVSWCRLFMQRIPEWAYDISDEEGMLMIGGNSFYTRDARNAAMEDSRFWENARSHVLGLIRRDRNHPSIVAWSLANEIECLYGSSMKSNREKYKTKEMNHIGNLIKKIDPTRPIMYDSSGGRFKNEDIVNIHYPYEWPYNNLLPQSTWWLEKPIDLDYNKQITMGWEKGKKWQRNLNKPLCLGETLYIVSSTPNVFSIIAGEKAYEDYRYYRDKTISRICQMYLKTYRYYKVGGVAPWSMGQSLTIGGQDEKKIFKEMFKPIACYIREYNNSFYGSEDFSRTIDVYNDSFKKINLFLHWKLKTKNRVISKDMKKFVLSPAGQREVQINSKLPEIKSKENMDFIVSLYEDKELRHQIKSKYHLYPNKIMLKIDSRIGLFDPANLCGELLKRIDIQDIVWIKTITPEILSRIKILLVAPDSIDKLTGSNGTIKRFAYNGGKVILLHQKVYPPQFLPLRLKTDTGFKTTITHSVAKGHPILEGVQEDALQFWAPDNIVSEDDIVLESSRKGLKPIILSGKYSRGGQKGGGLYRVSIAEIAYGDGLYVLCQMNTTQKSQEPLSAIIFSNILRHVDTYSGKAGKTLIIAHKDSSLRKAITDIGIKADYYQEGNDIKKYDIITLNGRNTITSEFLIKNKKQIAAYLKDGGKILLHLPSAKTLKNLTPIVNKAFRIVQPQIPVFVYKKDIDDPILWGITNESLYWAIKSNLPDLDIISQCVSYESKKKITEFLNLPGLLVKVQYGKGFLLIDNLNWSEKIVERGHRTKKALSLGSGLFVALKSNFFEEPERIEEEANIKEYSPIDLKLYCNMGFRDEIAGDGKGGWSDQGENDMRFFPIDLKRDEWIPGMPRIPFPARQNFNGVLFRIINPEENDYKSCIVLGSDEHLSSLPSEVTGIKVGKKFKYLHFLHASAWASSGKEIGAYRIIYEKGGGEIVKLIDNVNIAGWWKLNENMLDSTVAWIGKNPVHEPVAVYQYRWKNPYPEKEIKAIDFVGERKGIPILIAITGEK
jgi:beta-galactosidase